MKILTFFRKPPPKSLSTAAFLVLISLSGCGSPEESAIPAYPPRETMAPVSTLREQTDTQTIEPSQYERINPTNRTDETERQYQHKRHLHRQKVQAMSSSDRIAKLRSDVQHEKNEMDSLQQKLDGLKSIESDQRKRGDEQDRLIQELDEKGKELQSEVQQIDEGLTERRKALKEHELPNLSSPTPSP